MEYDSASNRDGRLKEFESSEDPPRLREIQKVERSTCTTNSTPWNSLQVVAPQPKLKLGTTTNRSLSSQVMEYYHKYSQNANLDQYFSLPATSTSPEAIKCYYSIYEVNPKLEANRQDCVGEDYSLRSYVPRERRRWVRPPLIGQSSNTETSPRYVQTLSNSESLSPDLKRVTPDTILEEKQESPEILTESTERKASSPTSSIASHKPLEWDSGADVGYFNILRNCKQSDKKLSTIERMALARGCSAALRLDPEGTTESGISGKLVGAQKSSIPSTIPDANSTPLLGNASGSESEIEITPIVKNHLPGIITGNAIKSNERSLPRDLRRQDVFAQYSKTEHDTPRSAFAPVVPIAKPGAEVKRVSLKQTINKENIYPPTSPLKKSTSMNTLIIPPSKLTLKRSQSELNLHGKDKGKAALPLIFHSSSSIATIVNKPSTCDKVIQTSPYAYSQESVGVQVPVLDGDDDDVDDERPPLPKRGTSLQKGLPLIPETRNPKGTYKVQASRTQNGDDTLGSLTSDRSSKETKPRHGYSQVSRNESGRRTPQPQDDAENVTGRANSFEYFPGHIYENVPNGSGSHISSSETGVSHSTLPNTSSSINDKLWGDSDSLVRDLERSVNILKSLVDANKCDKEVKKRLIHHVVKRLITAKYTDEKIEHNLEDNVPWNPDDARSKVYEREILRALTKKHNTSDSSADWNPGKQIVARGKIPSRRGIVPKGLDLGSSSDKMDKNTDRTETDGRKARMGLRSDDCPRSSNATSEPEKSESSECFFPQRNRKNAGKMQDVFCGKDRCKSQRDSSTTNTTPADRNRMLLDAVVNGRRAAGVRSSRSEDNADWRLLTTFSERQFELKKCGNSDSGDSKLVSYAEMEKRNQLIWITNEISHLCNLKKLLEEPRRGDRSRASPKKSRSGNFGPKPGAVGSLSRLHAALEESDYSGRNGFRPRANSMEDPWSSHCNLAGCQLSSGSSSVVQRVRKRNSCAQTATNVTGAHSKTGGEIVSASAMRNTATKLVSTGVQTVPQETSAMPALIQSEIVHYVKCPAHDAVRFQASCPRNEQAKQCMKRQTIPNTVSTCVQCLQSQKEMEKLREESPIGARISSPDTMNGNSLGSPDAIHRCASKDVRTEAIGQKEAKNQINASKSKHCDCNALSKGCQACVSAKCMECLKTARHPHGRDDGRSKECSCSTVEDRATNGRALVRHSSKCHRTSNGYAASSTNQTGRLDGCDCSAANGGEKPEAMGYCDCHSATAKTRYRGHSTEAENKAWLCRGPSNGQNPAEGSQYKVENGSRAKCGCEKEGCFCNAKARGDGKANFSDESSQTRDPDAASKYCRRCGAAYQNAKKCGCYQTYPRAVAYELSFARENDGSSATAVQKVALSSRGAGNEANADGCVCSVIKRVSPKKSAAQESTLQEYLSRNKAEFVNNAETRRRYMSEISQLRQLRKQKRIQLLAMASTSSVVKSPRTASKPAVYTQRKVSDEEMRERLRKRYLRLNEVRQKKRQQEKQEEARRNKLMAKIFCKKLQQKVLRGQVDLSQSVSVISNM